MGKTLPDKKSLDAQAAPARKIAARTYWPDRPVAWVRWCPVCLNHGFTLRTDDSKRICPFHAEHRRTS